MKVLEITGAGCVGDTSYDTISIDYKLVTPPIQGDTSVCANTGGHVYSIVYSAGSVYDWTVTGGAITAYGNASITVQWGSAGQGVVSVLQTAYDSVIGRQCVGQPIFLNVNIYSVPVSTPIVGPNSFCTGSSTTFSVAPLQGVTYVWMINDTIPTFTTGSYTLTDTFTRAGNYIISLLEISAHNCAGALQTENITVYPGAKTSGITGPVNLCAPAVGNITYSVINTPGSAYAWQVAGGMVESGQGQNQVTVTWLQGGVDSLTVTETNSFGCPGKPITLKVLIDSLAVNVIVATTELLNENLVSLKWQVNSTAPLRHGYSIYRVEPGHNSWELLDTVPDTVFTYIDKTANTQAKSYYYRVSARNSCDVEVLSAPHRTILLQGLYYNDSSNTIYWNSYQGWPSGVYSYRLYYGVDQDTALRYIGYTTDTNITELSTENGYRVCYRVQALDNADTTITSLSNKVCFDLEPVVFVPNAFTPHPADGLNDVFHISAINYTSFHLEVYNRWGEEIFSSSDPKNQWDGTFKGKPCPADEYLYILEVDGHTKKIYKSGTVLILE